MEGFLVEPLSVFYIVDKLEFEAEPASPHFLVI
jgi:hypothetical protein